MCIYIYIYITPEGSPPVSADFHRFLFLCVSSLIFPPVSLSVRFIRRFPPVSLSVRSTGLRGFPPVSLSCVFFAGFHRF